jgi:hypothetical protein
MKTYRAVANNNEFVEFKATNNEEARHYVINHFDMSREWFIFQVVGYEEAGREYIKNNTQIFELYDDGSEAEFCDFNYVPEHEVFGIEVSA